MLQFSGMHAKAAKNLVKIENRQKLAAGVTKTSKTL
jgi:hypothetical protein